MGERVNFILKICSLVLVIIVAGLRAGAGVDTRPKYRDEETLIAGTIWTHILITIGLIMSAVGGEYLSVYVHAYFLFACTVLLIVTGSILTTTKLFAIREAKRLRARQVPYLEDRQVREPQVGKLSLSDLPVPSLPVPVRSPQTSVMKMNDKTYLAIGLLMIWASCFTFADFIMIIVY